ncbi:MAG: hypothetical protein ASARMPRED_008788 [Alectoria sarmentosa]|nr:MAG: hypothetical protein ASARMPRED_008788 [Alectoria sarmentosa]
MSSKKDETEESRWSDPSWSKAFTKTKDVPFWIPDIDDKITPDIRRLLEQYSKIPPQGVVKHIYDIREAAWQIRSYPCTGSALFLRPLLPLCPVYPTILQRLQSDATFIDIGCFIGHDLRQLVIDGAPSSNLYAVDIVSHWDIGYDMFRDRDTFSATFMEADILHPNEALLALKGRIDVINITHVLHQWDWAGQIAVARNLVSLSRGTGALVVGFQVGSAGPNRIGPHSEENSLGTKEVFWHSPDTFAKMWEEVGRATGTRWEVQAALWTWEETGWKAGELRYMGDCARILQFVASRVG